MPELLIGSKYVQVKATWPNEGARGWTIGPNVRLGAVEWTPIEWENHDNPSFYKTIGLEPAGPKAKKCLDCGRAPRPQKRRKRK